MSRTLPMPVSAGLLPADADFLKALRWDAAAPRSLTTAARQGDVAGFCQALRKSGRFGPGGAKKKSPLLLSTSPASPLAHAEGNGRPRKRGTSEHAGATTAVELLALFDRIQQHGRELDDGDLFPLWRSALTAALDQVGRFDDAGLTEDQRLIVQGELPWRAGLLFAGLTDAERFRRAGRRVLRERLLALTEANGLPRGDLLPRLADWLAPLVRSAAWAKRYDEKLWDEKSAARFRGLVKTATACLRSDGRLALADPASPDPLPLLTAAASLAGLKEKSRPVQLLRAVERRKKSDGKEPKKPVVFQSDEARLACVRNCWSPDADLFVVAHHPATPLQTRRTEFQSVRQDNGETLQAGEPCSDGLKIRPTGTDAGAAVSQPLISLSALGAPLLDGLWEMELSIAGEPFALEGEWECCCWHSDSDADYLELQMTFPGDLRIERQVLLSRDEHFLVLADCISGVPGQRIEYTSRLPLVEGVTVEADRPTRECRLTAGRRTARVFPLALPSDRVQSAAGSLTSADGSLELAQLAEGGLLAPLMIDWHPRRRRAPADWRKLTVTEQGRILGTQDASGHRLRIGDHQLLIYRSVRKGDQTRAVLGYHTPHETVIGRFDSDGELEPILLVE